MAAKTLTYTINMQSQPRGVHVGVNHLTFDFNSGAGKLGTISDVVLLGKVPNGALLLTEEMQFGIQTSAGTNWALVLLVTESSGAYSTYATLIASMTASLTAAVFRNIAPLKVSLSDHRAVQYATLALNCTTGASETVSFSFKGHVLYTADGSNV